MVGDARVVLLGEATHGTHEFYRERARITQRLIVEKGFTAVAVEGDWPRAYRVNRYVRGASTDSNADAALSLFTDFPVWMWRNTDVRDLVEWIRTYNRSAATPAAFYGLDLYSLRLSTAAVVEHLAGVDPQAAARPGPLSLLRAIRRWAGVRRSGGVQQLPLLRAAGCRAAPRAGGPRRRQR